MLAPASLSVTPTFCRLTFPHRRIKTMISGRHEVDSRERWASPEFESIRLCSVLFLGGLLSFLPFSFTCLYFDLWLLDTNIDVIVIATEARPPRARTDQIITSTFFAPDTCSATQHRSIQCLCSYIYRDVLKRQHNTELGAALCSHKTGFLNTLNRLNK